MYRKLCLEDVVEQAKRTGICNLSGCRLKSVPPCIFAIGNIKRLDLSYNMITEIGDDIAKLTQLQELWVNSNPLKTLSPLISQCKSLQYITLADTQISQLPFSVGDLNELFEIDLTNVSTLSDELMGAYKFGTISLKKYLLFKGNKHGLKIKMLDKLATQVYKEEAATEEGREKIKSVVKKTMKRFSTLSDMSSYTRNISRLVPDKMDMLDESEVLGKFDLIKQDNRKKKRLADLELILRALYFESADGMIIENMMKSIDREFKEIRDISFLISHSNTIIPADVSEFDAKTLLVRVYSVRKEIDESRQKVISQLLTQVSALYFDIEPQNVKQLVNATAKLFLNIDELRQLAADPSVFFPKVFDLANPKSIRARFAKSTVLHS